jgi:hypothetical protein
MVTQEVGLGRVMGRKTLVLSLGFWDDLDADVLKTPYRQSKSFLLHGLCCHVPYRHKF